MGNTADKTTLRGFLERIERQYGKARRVWLMDRGLPTEEVLAEMRAADPPLHYLVGTPKGRLTRLERHLIAQPWQQARPGVQVKLLAQQGELYVLAQSRDRVAKERAMRRRRLKRLWARLKQLSTMQLTREELLMKLGAAVVVDGDVPDRSLQDLAAAAGRGAEDDIAAGIGVPDRGHLTRLSEQSRPDDNQVASASPWSSGSRSASTGAWSGFLGEYSSAFDTTA